MKRIALLAALVAAIAVGVFASSAAAMPADTHGAHVAKAPLMCACGGGGLPYCDAGELGVQLYATWIVWFALPPSGYAWESGVFKCEYNSAASVARTWTLQVGLDPDSGPGKFWLLA